MKATDAVRVNELCGKRSQYLQALEPPAIVPMKQGVRAPNPIEFHICQRSASGDYDLWSMGVLPPEFVRIYFIQKLAEVERELLQLGVTL